MREEEEEPDVGGLLTEALTAEIEAVLADETGLVGAYSAGVVGLVTEPISLNLLLPASTGDYWSAGVSLQPQRLDPGISFDDARPTPKWIIGKGQKIYWRRCFIRVYTTTNRLSAQQNTETCDGQAVVPQGTELFLGGEGGRVKEEQVASTTIFPSPVIFCSVAASSSDADSSSADAFSSTLLPPRPKRPRLNRHQVTDPTFVEPIASAGPSTATGTSSATVSSSATVFCPDPNSSSP
ncbi:hypothetical protein CIB48_g7428 [Xylaria polymorpha]|nr:hypothetical protein CIB48_g7428 [Xylaria polymorpha]